MTPFQARQGWLAALVLGLFAPVIVSVGFPSVARLWPGLAYVGFMCALVCAYIVLSWIFAILAFGAETRPKDDRPEGEA